MIKVILKEKYKSREGKLFLIRFGCDIKEARWEPLDLIRRLCGYPDDHSYDPKTSEPWDPNDTMYKKLRASMPRTSRKRRRRF